MMKGLQKWRVGFKIRDHCSCASRETESWLQVNMSAGQSVLHPLTHLSGQIFQLSQGREAKKNTKVTTSLVKLVNSCHLLDLLGTNTSHRKDQTRVAENRSISFPADTCSKCPYRTKCSGCVCNTMGTHPWQLSLTDSQASEDHGM